MNVHNISLMPMNGTISFSLLRKLDHHDRVGRVSNTCDNILRVTLISLTVQLGYNSRLLYVLEWLFEKLNDVNNSTFQAKFNVDYDTSFLGKNKRRQLALVDRGS